MMQKSLFSSKAPNLDGIKLTTPTSPKSTFIKDTLSISEISPIPIQPHSSKSALPKDSFFDGSAQHSINQIYDSAQLIRPLLDVTDRTDTEALFLYENLKHLKFFNQFLKDQSAQNVDIFLQICKRLGYETKKSGSIIMKQGDYSNGKVYIIFRGQLLVYIKGAPPPPKAKPLVSVSSDSSPRRNNVTQTGSTKAFMLQTAHNSDRTLDQTNEESQKILRRQNLRQEIFYESPISRKNRAENERDAKDISPNVKLNLIVNNMTGGFDKSNKGPSSPKNSFSSYLKYDSAQTKTNTEINIRSDPAKSSRTPQKTGSPMDKMEEVDEYAVYGTLVNKIEEGSFFGEKALTSKLRRGATIIASTDVELLTVRSEDFLHIRMEFNNTRAAVTQFIQDAFPNISYSYTPGLLDTLVYNCELVSFQYKKIVTNEGDLGNKFFIVYEGQCEFTKTLIYDNSQRVGLLTNDRKQLFGLTKTKKDEFVLSKGEKGTFIGEEILFNDSEKYEYTVRVHSDKVRLLSFNKAKFGFRCPKMITKGLLKIYSSKKNRNAQIFETLVRQRTGRALDSQINEQDLDSLKEINPVMSLHKRKRPTSQPPIRTLSMNKSQIDLEGLASIRQEEVSREIKKSNMIFFPDAPQISSDRNNRMTTLSCKNVTDQEGDSERENASNQRGNSKALDKNSHRSENKNRQSFIDDIVETNSTLSSARRLFSANSSALASVQNFNHLSGIRNSYRNSPKQIDSVMTTNSAAMEQNFFSPRQSMNRSIFASGGHPYTGSKEPSDKILKSILSKQINSAHKKGRPMSENKAIRSPRDKVPIKPIEYSAVLNYQKDKIIRKRQKSLNIFEKKSIGFTYSLSKNASVISFGSPKTTPNSPRNFTPKQRKLISKFNMDFENNFSQRKTDAANNSIKRSQLQDFVKIDVPQKIRSKSAQSPNIVHMDVQFLSGLTVKNDF